MENHRPSLGLSLSIAGVVFATIAFTISAMNLVAKVGAQPPENRYTARVYDSKDGQPGAWVTVQDNKTRAQAGLSMQNSNAGIYFSEAGVPGYSFFLGQTKTPAGERELTIQVIDDDTFYRAKLTDLLRAVHLIDDSAVIITAPRPIHEPGDTPQDLDVPDPSND